MWKYTAARATVRVGSISGWTLRTVKENSLKTDVCDLYGNNSALILSQELVSDMLSVFG